MARWVAPLWMFQPTMQRERRLTPPFELLLRNQDDRVILVDLVSPPAYY